MLQISSNILLMALHMGESAIDFPFLKLVELYNRSINLRTLVAQGWNPSRGVLLFGEWSTRCWPGSPQITEKATARSMCIPSTAQPLYQGAEMQEGQSQEILLAKSSAKLQV